MEKSRSSMAKFAMGCFGFIAVIIVGIPCAIMAIFWFQSIPRDVSAEVRYAEIYNQTFEVQKELFLHKWPGSGHYALEKHNSDIATVEPGTRLKVKKITKDHGFATTHVIILADIDNPKFPKYKSIDASDLVNDTVNLSYRNDLVQFDPEYLRNIEVKSLHTAVQYEDFKTVKRLAESGADIDRKNLDGRTPLHFARQTDIAEYLLSKGANPDAADQWGKTLLHYAAKEKNFKMIMLLLQSGAYIDPKDEDGDTPLLVAAHGNYLDIVAFLLESGANSKVKGKYQETVLLHAAHHDELDAIKLSLMYGADPLAVNSLGKMSGILFAARNNNIEMAQLFVNAGSPVNSANDDGDTPLHYAYRNLNLLQYFCENGAVVQRTNKRGRSVLHEACYKSDLEVVRYLCEKGALVNQPDFYGQTPMDIAKESAQTAILRLLKRYDRQNRL